MKHIPPTLYAASFTCPHCGAIAHQKWHDELLDGGRSGDKTRDRLRIAKCAHCGEHSVWIDDKMAYPYTGDAPLANVEIAEEVKNCYSEASEIVTRSPRAAAALLRLAIQLLCKELGEPGKNINDDIASLASKGLPEIVQQSLDVVRVTCNDAVHLGNIDADDPKVVGDLFDLVYIIVEYMLAMPKRVSGLYGNLPANTLAGIHNRDS